MNRALRLLLLLALAAYSGWTLWAERAGRIPRAAVVLDAEGARELCAASGYPESAFWERAKTIGVTGVLFLPRTLEAAVRGADIIHVTRGDVQKMRAFGLVGVHSPLRTDSIWFHEKADADLLALVLGRRGLAVSAADIGGLHGLLLPEAAPGASMTVGFDRSRVEAAFAKDLVPVFEAADTADLEAGLPLAPSAVFLASEGFRGDPRAVPAWGECLLSGCWSASRPRAEKNWLEASSSRGQGRVLLAGRIRIGEGIAGARRELSGRGADLLLADLDPSRTVENNLDSVRFLLAGLREEGRRPGLPARISSGPVPSWEGLARLFLACLLAVSGSVAALRNGLDALRWARSVEHLPQAAPLREALLGFAAALGTSALAGLAVHAVLPGRSWMELRAMPFEAVVLGSAFLMGGVSLFPSRGRGQAPGLPARFLSAVLFCAALFLLLSPAWMPMATGSEGLTRILWAGKKRWWLALRWREAFIGLPCLFAGFWVYLERVERAKPWLILGLLSLAGTVLAFSLAVPFELSLLHTAQAGLLALPVGLLLVWLRVKTAG